MIKDKVQALNHLIHLLEEKEEYELCAQLVRWREEILNNNDTPLELTTNQRVFFRGLGIDISEL